MPSVSFNQHLVILPHVLWGLKSYLWLNKSDSCYAVIQFCWPLVWLQTELDSTESYYHYIVVWLAGLVSSYASILVRALVIKRMCLGFLVFTRTYEHYISHGFCSLLNVFFNAWLEITSIKNFQSFFPFHLLVHKYEVSGC